MAIDTLTNPSAWWSGSETRELDDRATAQAGRLLLSPSAPGLLRRHKEMEDRMT
jgi:hypothetical protein